MKRAALEKSRTKRVWKAHLHNNHRAELAAGKVQCRCDLQANRFRKGQKQGGCGNARCFVCHSEKLLDVPKHRDLKQLAREQDGEREEG